MNDDIKIRVMAVLLKTLYKQKLISEDIYNHSLNNLPKALDYGQGFGCNAAGRETQTDGCVQNP